MIREEWLNPSSVLYHLPVAVIIARNRLVVSCNEQALKIFRASYDQLIGQSFSILYPEQKDFESAAQYFGPLLSKHAVFHDDRLMRRLDGSHFWVTVRGHGFHTDNPYELAVWVFTAVDDISPLPVNRKVSLTAREREVAVLLVDGLSSKAAAKKLNISHRTVDIHRGSLLKKYSVNSTAELIQKIVS